MIDTLTWLRQRAAASPLETSLYLTAAADEIERQRVEIARLRGIWAEEIKGIEGVMGGGR